MTPEENQRLEAIERRLDELAEQVARLSSGTHAPILQMPRRPEAPRPVPRTARIETAVGLTWISRIAVVTVVLALAFFFEYAFENHWISPAGRVLLGMICGAAALLAGERLWRTGQRTYAQSLTAAGIAFFYLSLWAGFALYHLFSQPFTFAAMLLATAAAGALSMRYNAPAVAMLGLAGGYATPLLLGSTGIAWFVLAYALILDVGAAWAARVKHWRWPEALAVAGTAVLYLSQTAEHGNTVFVVAYYVLFAASREAGVVVAAQLLAGAAAASLWAPGLFGVALAGAFAGGGLEVADWRGWGAIVPASLAGFWLAFALWWESASSGTLSAMPLVTAVFLIFLGWPVWRVWRRNLPLRLPDLLAMALNAGLYYGAAYSLLRPAYEGFEGLLAVAVAGAQMGVARMLWGRDERGSLLGAGAACVMLVLAAPIQFAGYRITIAWALEGAAVVWIGTRLTEKRAVAGGLAVLGLAVARLLLVDGQMYANPAGYTAIVNARFLSFAVTAVALWGSAWWIRQGKLALASYACGHAVMLWGLALETIGWAARTAAPQDFRSVASTSLSVLAGVYAVLLVAGGAAGRSAVTRILGVSLIGLVVVKLYLYDVWLLGQFYRMAAFAILGVLLLAMSYLYSRWRENG